MYKNGIAESKKSGSSITEFRFSERRKTEKASGKEYVYSMMQYIKTYYYLICL